MTEESTLHVLALVPNAMRNAMRNLHQAVTGSVTECATADDFGRKSCERNFEVVLIPAGNLSPQEWWEYMGRTEFNGTPSLYPRLYRKILLSTLGWSAELRRVRCRRYALHEQKIAECNRISRRRLRAEDSG